MVLLDIDEYIWPEYVPPSDAAASSSTPSSSSSVPDDQPTRAAADNKNAADGDDHEEEGRRLYSGEGNTTLLPSHVPRFSPRTKLRAAAALLGVLVISLLLLLTIGLTVLQSGTPSTGAAVTRAPPPSAAAPHPMDTPGSPDAVASTGSSSSGTSASDGGDNDDDPCPIELSAAHKCFVEQQQQHRNQSTSTSSTYVSASVAQSECVSCLATLWPTSADDPPLCGMDNATLCQEMLSCDCGICSGLVSAYLICATHCSSSGINDDGLLSSMPASCQQLLEVDPTSPSTVDLFPPYEPTNTTFTEQGNSSTTLTSPPAPTTTSQPPSPMPTPTPKCHNASSAFNECVDPDQGDGANCLLCLLSYWPSSSSGPADDDDTSSATTTTTATSSLACDDELVNATCVGLDMCDNHCHGCRDAYIAFLKCQVDTCRDASNATVLFLCP